MRRFSARPTLLSAFAIVGCIAAAAPAWAQTTSERRWELEGYGGAVLATGPGDGNAVLPPAGAPIATASPIFPSRRVPSWMFGDGAMLLNDVNEQFGVTAVLQPLDALLGAAGLDANSGFAGGVRVRRALNDRFSVEGSLDLMPASATLSSELFAAADVTRESFAAAFQGLLATGPFTDVNIATSLASGGSARELGVTGSLVYQFGSSGGFRPYVTLGGGVITGAGSGPEVMIEGNYSFRIVGEVPIDETDRVTIRMESRTVLTGVLGAGLRRDVSDRWGFRIDGRVLVAPSTAQLLIDADPSVAEGAPADFVESFTAPSVQFSNSASTGRESSLGQPALAGFQTFAPGGLQARVLITAGVFFRF